MSDGSTPEPPDIAYQQFINGQKVSEFTTDEMLYVMLNPRSNTPYGLAPLETLILGVDAALRSQLYNLKLLTEGNAPEGFFSLPETWSPQQLKEFETYFNGTIAGNPRFQQRIKFMPGGKGVGYVPTKKPDEMRFLEYEKWLLMKCCAMFDVPPEEIGFTETVNKSTGEQQNQIAKNSGLEPMLQVLKENFDLIIQEDLGCPFLHLDWQSSDVKDEKKDAEISQILFPTGAISVDEWRVKNGLDPIGLEHYIQTPAGPILVKDFLEFGSLGVAPIEETPEPAPKEKPENNKEQKIEELLRWKKKAITTIKEGKKPKKFDTDKIDKIEVQLIEAQLYLAKSKEDVRKIFEKFLSSARQEYIFEQSAKLKEDISKTLREYEKPVVAKT